MAKNESPEDALQAAQKKLEDARKAKNAAISRELKALKKIRQVETQRLG